MAYLAGVISVRMIFLQVSVISKQQAGMAVLSDINFIQQRFQKIAIAGETGSGKSTLLKIIAGLEQPDTGTILFEEKKVIGPLETLIPGHPGIAYLSQHFELRNNYRVEELLEYANRLSETEAEKLFAVCRINHLLKRKVDQLSGGEKQRIALARLLVGSPRLLLLDEPFSNLDPGHKRMLKSVLNDIGRRLQITCILTSHDPMDTLSWADTILVMQNGRIVQQGSPLEIYHHPLTEYTAGLFGNYNLLSDTEASLFPGSEKKNNQADHFFIRPEQFIISSSPQKNTVKGKIEDSSFWGGFYELTVGLGEKKIVVRSINGDFAIGDDIYISLKNTRH
jgi:ABC-type sulfate/molybdate transport systems ATPase subunit